MYPDNKDCLKIIVPLSFVFKEPCSLFGHSKFPFRGRAHLKEELAAVPY